MPTNSDLMTNDRWMPGWLKFSFLSAFVFLTCWGVAIAVWRMPGHNPTTGEMGLYLLGLPLGLLLISFIGHKLIAQRNPAKSTVGASTPAKESAMPSQISSHAILAASLRLPHGASVEELAAAIADNKARPDLDKELVDGDGFPILSVRSGDGQDETLQEEIVEWLAIGGKGELSFSDEQWRALTLATAVVGELAAKAASLLQHRAETHCVLKLIPVLPVEWDVVHRHAAAAWFVHVVEQSGWPAGRIVLQQEHADPGHMVISTILDSLAVQAVVNSPPSIAMVVACASYIGDETVAQWAANGSLFTSSRPLGRIPGEGAAGILITDAEYAKSIEGAAFSLLEAIEEARRETSADESRRIDSTVLVDLTERSLKRSGIGFSNVNMVIADTGQRSNRVLELMGHVSAAMPQLDGNEDVLRIGAACGTCGAVPFVAALALGRYYVIECDAKVLCISNEDPFHRCAALMRS